VHIMIAVTVVTDSAKSGELELHDCP
jgi:hypothetical protein